MLHSSVRIATVALVAALLWSVPSSPRAGESFDSRVEGTYGATTSEAEARESIDEKIEEVVSQMVFFKRPFARSKLKEGTEPCSTIRIGLDSRRVTLRCDDRKPTTTKKDGTSTEWTDSEGETYTLSQKVESDQIVQSFESERGTRTNTYSLTDDDTLLLEVEIDGSQLPEPLTYSRTFDRKK